MNGLDSCQKYERKSLLCTDFFVEAGVSQGDTQHENLLNGTPDLHSAIAM